MKRAAMILVMAFAIAVGTGGAADAVTVRMGNDAVDRNNFDTYHDFTIVDTNNPAAFDGTFTQIEFYVERAGDIRFVVVEPDGTVAWVSDVVTGGAVGTQTATFASPVGVTKGSNLGVYSLGHGVVSWSYDSDGAPADFTPDGSGEPSVGQTLAYQGSSERLYSMNAAVSASSPDVCKKGGWETYGYRNQGQCIASVVANEQAGK